MCLGRASHFGQHWNCSKIQIWTLNRLTHIQFNVWGMIWAWKVKGKTHDLNHSIANSSLFPTFMYLHSNSTQILAPKKVFSLFRVQIDFSYYEISGPDICSLICDLNHDLTFSAHTINCVCHSIRSMFRVLGIYNFAQLIKKYINPYSTAIDWCKSHLCENEEHIS